MTVYGYMRISTNNQKFDSQEKALLHHGVDVLFKEQESGRNEKRPVLSTLLSQLKTGDTLIIFKLDRLARSAKQLLSLLDDFEKRNINFVSIENNIDTSTPMGKFFLLLCVLFQKWRLLLLESEF